MQMMERIGRALGGDIGEQQDGDGDGDEMEHERTYLPSRSLKADTQQVHYGAGIRRPLGGGAMLVGSSSPSYYSESVATSRSRDDDHAAVSPGFMLEIMKPPMSLPGTRLTRLFPMPDLYQCPPGVSRPTMNASALTNTSPMHHPTQRAVPFSSAGIQRRNPSSRMNFLMKSTDLGVEKTSKDSEVDMNLPFPVKLHYILSHPKYQDCVAWLHHGRAWRILKPKAFEKGVIPRFFRSAKYASFMRQVR